MKTEEELNHAIVKITMKIADKFPELVKYIEEMPVTIPDNAGKEVTLKSLREYYDSLEALFKKYASEHVPAAK